MKSILAIFLAAAIVTPLSAQEPDCWHYENGDGSIIGSVNTQGTAYDVAVSGDYAFVAADSAGLIVVDVTDPTTPQVALSLDLDGSVRGVEIQGNYAYAISSRPGGPPRPRPEVWDIGMLSTINLTDPANPQIESTEVIGQSMYGIAVSGNYAYVLSTAQIAPIMMVVDISNPAYPEVMGADVIPLYTGTLAVSGDFVFVPNYFRWGLSGFYTIDVSDPFDPVSVLNGVSIPISTRGVTVRDDLLYLGGFSIFDVSVPTSPEMMGQIDMGDDAKLVAVAGEFAYVATVDEIQVVDISTPPFPVLVGGVDIPSYARGGQVAGDYLYLADGDAGLQIMLQQCNDIVSTEDDPVEPEPDANPPSASLSLVVHPNPFNPQTTVTFSLEHVGWAKVGVYELTGRHVTVLTNQPFTLGAHTLTWNGRDSQGRAMPSGTYIVRLETESCVEARKVMLMR